MSCTELLELMTYLSIFLTISQENAQKPLQYFQPAPLTKLLYAEREEARKPISAASCLRLNLS